MRSGPRRKARTGDWHASREAVDGASTYCHSHTANRRHAGRARPPAALRDPRRGPRGRLGSGARPKRLRRGRVALLGRQRAVHALLAAGPDRAAQRHGSGGGVALADGRPRAAGSEPAVARRPQRGHAAHGERRAVHRHRPGPDRGARSGDRRDALGARSAQLRAGPLGRRRIHPARPGVLDRRQRGTRAGRHHRRASHLAGRAHRAARRGVRGRRAGRPARRRAAHEPRRAARGRPAAAGGRRRGGHRQLHLGPSGQPRDAARLGARLRRAQRPPAVDVLHGAARVRGGLRDVAQRLGRVLRQRQRVGRHGLRPRARLRLPAHVDADERLLRRPAARGQPVRREPRLPGGADRPPRLALPGRAPRPVGLRLRVDPRAGRHHRRRPADQGGHPGQQAGLRLRVRPRDRRAGVADRGAPGAGIDGARRVDGADPALPHPAAALRSAGRDRGEPDRLHAGAQAAGAGAARAVRPRPALHAAVAARHADPARHRRRRQLARRGVRYRDGPLLRGVPHEPVAHRGIAGRCSALQPAVPRAGGRARTGRRGRHARRGEPHDGRRPAAVQAAVLPGHRHRHEHGR